MGVFYLGAFFSLRPSRKQRGEKSCNGNQSRRFLSFRSTEREGEREKRERNISSGWEKTFVPRSRQFYPGLSLESIPSNYPGYPVNFVSRPCLQLCPTFRVTANWMERAPPRSRKTKSLVPINDSLFQMREYERRIKREIM